MQIKEIITQLKAPFPHQCHKDRKLPGGGRWFYVPWQDIRDRLDEVAPEWQVSYSEPGYLGEYCHISCTITIEGISRSAPGNAPIQLLSSSGKDMSRGTPIERAIADAFKNAAEAWGVARYLDNQEFVVKYMQSKGDMRAYKYWQENQQIEVGARGNKPSKNQEPQPLKLQPQPQQSSIDRQMVRAEIASLLRRRNISVDNAKELCFQFFGVHSTDELNNQQLIELRDRFSVLQN